MQPFTLADFKHQISVQDLIQRKVSIADGAILAIRVPPSSAPFNFAQESPAAPSNLESWPSLSHSAGVNGHPRRLACLLHYYKVLRPPGQPESPPYLELRLLYIYSSSCSRAPFGLNFGDFIPETDLTYRQVLIPNTITSTTALPSDPLDYTYHPEPHVTFEDTAGVAFGHDGLSWTAMRLEKVLLKPSDKIDVFVPPSAQPLPPRWPLPAKPASRRIPCITATPESLLLLRGALHKLDLKEATRRQSLKLARAGQGDEGDDRRSREETEERLEDEADGWEAPSQTSSEEQRAWDRDIFVAEWEESLWSLERVEGDSATAIEVWRQGVMPPD